MNESADKSEPHPALSAIQGRWEGEKLLYLTEEMFQGRREVWLEHRGEQYRLRITSSGKLLLTK